MNPTEKRIVPLSFILFLLWVSFQPLGALAQKPNIIVILCDDLGIGDVGCFNSSGKIATPSIDQLAAEGIRFTNAHSSSAVCTPTRYSLLTGRYNWRSRLQRGVLGGLSPRLIEPTVPTLADYLKQQGYQTACIGKWHLGMDWAKRSPEDPQFQDNIEKGAAGWKIDYEKKIENGPLAVGFDHFFGISASLDMVPYTFIQDAHVTQVPTVDVSHPMMLGRKPKQTTRRGPGYEGFDPADVLPKLVEQTELQIRTWQSEQPESPFFLYIPFASPHTPIAPNPQWQGKSGLNPYADFVMETDAAIGKIDQLLQELEIADQTLLIVTSDNGCSPQADFAELANREHHPSADYRGHKADIFEGGHRVPFVARYPGKIAPQRQSDQLIGLQDIFATVVDLLDSQVDDSTAVDSISWWPIALDQMPQDENLLRQSLVHHSINGSFAIRRGPWKLCFCPDSGGWSNPRPNSPAAKDLPALQLYQMQRDQAEQENLAQQYPEVVLELTAEMDRLIQRGRTTPGAKQSNTVPVQWQAPELEAPR